MKKTTYIIIALAILPIVLVFLSPFILPLYADEKNHYADWVIVLSGEMAEKETQPFEYVKVHAEADYSTRGKMKIILTQGESSSLKIPAELDSLIECDFINNTLAVNIVSPDNTYRYIVGDTLLVIETPNLKKVKSNFGENILIQGFKGDLSIDFDETASLTNCEIDTLTVMQAGLLLMANSNVNYANVSGSSKFEVVTDSARIENMTFAAYGNSVLTCSEANIGTLNTEPSEGTITISTNKPVTIRPDNYGTND